MTENKKREVFKKYKQRFLVAKKIPVFFNNLNVTSIILEGWCGSMCSVSSFNKIFRMKCN